MRPVDTYRGARRNAARKQRTPGTTIAERMVRISGASWKDPFRYRGPDRRALRAPSLA